MPIYMDLHILPGVKAKDVAEAHHRDMLVQDEHECKCMTYWIDEKRGNVFCLIDAPSEEAVKQMHHNSHGLIPHRIIEVDDSLVDSFLGRISDPEEATLTDNGLKVFSDSSFRIILVIKSTDPVLLRHQLGKEKAAEMLSRFYAVTRAELAAYDGSEADHTDAGFIASFTSAAKAVNCAESIQNKIAAADIPVTGLRIGIHAGEPVTANGQLFGDAILFAARLCAINNKLQVAVSSAVKDVLAKSELHNKEYGFMKLLPQDEITLGTILNTMEQHWQESEYNMDQYCRAMAMSKTQLYRKTMLLFGYSPNALLNEYRLEKAKKLMQRRQHNISQVAFETGFTSPSYFTKCFKKKFGMLPNTYLELLD